MLLLFFSCSGDEGESAPEEEGEDDDEEDDEEWRNEAEGDEMAGREMLLSEENSLFSFSSCCSFSSSALPSNVQGVYLQTLHINLLITFKPCILEQKVIK